MTSGRQTPTTTRPSLKTKSNKQINNSNSTKPSVPSSTQSNLLGKVDLDDEDDLLSKYQTKKMPIELNINNHNNDELTSTVNKFNSNIQTMIDSKWNAYKTSFHQSDEEQDEESEDEVDEDLYPNTRQRTSSRSSGTQSKAQPRKVWKTIN
jgi:hypothetical protein